MIITNVAIVKFVVCGIDRNKMKKEKKEKIIKALEGEKEFENLYNIYLKVWGKNHKTGNPVCYNEWIDNELEELRIAYRRYLKETCLLDKNELLDIKKRLIVDNLK